ncbi:hypothetical protein PR048_033491 [Dryococelus australis]|uniref:Uncharacterized protein n=1 Tax=Dryococelus australis TaxID=614101 RepID=A0ABQ9G1N8_9NEOP|nr:hypothetical protein PR048_033491 [Dryococelus australis]
MPLVGGFSRGSPVSPALFIPALFHTRLATPSSALKTSMGRGLPAMEVGEAKDGSREA